MSLPRFRGDWPDVRFEGLTVQRAAIHPTDEPVKTPEIVWEIFGANPQGRVPLTVLFGDLSLFDGPWFVGVTVKADVRFRSRAGKKDWLGERAVDEGLESLAQWASEVMWDQASLAGRSLTSLIVPDRISLPTAAPRAAWGGVLVKRNADEARPD